MVIYNEAYNAPIYCHVLEIRETEVPEKHKKWYEDHKDFYKNGARIEVEPAKEDGKKKP